MFSDYLGSLVGGSLQEQQIRAHAVLECMCVDHPETSCLKLNRGLSVPEPDCECCSGPLTLQHPFHIKLWFLVPSALACASVWCCQIPFAPFSTQYNTTCAVAYTHSPPFGSASTAAASAAFARLCQLTLANNGQQQPSCSCASARRGTLGS